MNHLPSSSLLHSRSARIELARRRFFEDGQAPTGVVSEAVFESWSRCLRLHGSPHDVAMFEPVTASRTQLALLKNRDLHQAWMNEAPRLEAVLGTTSCAAMLTDASGVLIGSSCVGRPHEALMPVATRLGVNLSEDAVGTTAPGVAARTGKPVSVIAGEHFFDSVSEMHCAAVPIRDIHGQVAGVLDLSSECHAFAFDAAAVAGVFAAAIENRLLVAQSTQHLVIRLQVAPELLDTAMVGLIGLDADARIAWANGAAHKLLGGLLPAPHARGRALDDSIGLAWPELASLPAVGAAPLGLPSGLQVWARAEMHSPDGRRGWVSLVRPRGHGAGLALQAAAHDSALAPSGATDMASAAATPQVAEELPDVCGKRMTQRLRDSDRELIQQTLQACDGNVSHAAKRLGVSRGLIYRRLYDARPTGATERRAGAHVPKRNTADPV